MTQNDIQTHSGQILLVAVYDDEAHAQSAIERLNSKDVAMDMLSVLGKVHPSGDDVLGIYHTGIGDRVKAWAKQGALWGALWGLLAGAAGMFLIPGLGAIFAAGPVVESIVATLAGGVAGSSLGGAAMAGAAAMTQLATVMHRMGVPQDQLDHLHQAIEDGHYVLLLRQDAHQIQPWLDVLRGSEAKEVLEFPY